MKMLKKLLALLGLQKIQRDVFFSVVAPKSMIRQRAEHLEEQAENHMREAASLERRMKEALEYAVRAQNLAKKFRHTEAAMPGD